MSKCKHCKECKEYTYERLSKKGEPITFLYCEGNKEEVNLSNWYIQKDGYAYSTGRINGKKIFFHVLFKKDKTMYIDHINGNRCDNRLKNLRECTPLCNNQNNHYAKKTSKYIGVFWNKKLSKWQSRTALGKQGRKGSIHFGYFDTEEEAYHAYVTGLRSNGLEVNTLHPCYKDYEKWLSDKCQTVLI